MTREKTYKKIVVVDRNDRVIGSEMLFDAIKKECLRSGVRVFVFSESGQLLLQKRSQFVRHPLLYGISADGHVDEGETRPRAALRELREETGIAGYQLQELNASFPAPGTINGIYKVVVPDDVALQHDPHEVEELRWVTIEELESLLHSDSKKFTIAFLDTWNQFKNQLISA